MNVHARLFAVAVFVAFAPFASASCCADEEGLYRVDTMLDVPFEAGQRVSTLSVRTVGGEFILYVPEGITIAGLETEMQMESFEEPPPIASDELVGVAGQGGAVADASIETAGQGGAEDASSSEVGETDSDDGTYRTCYEAQVPVDNDYRDVPDWAASYRCVDMAKGGAAVDRLHTIELTRADATSRRTLPILAVVTGYGACGPLSNELAVTVSVQE